MRATVLLLDEGTALAFVGVVAIVALCLLSLALVGIVFVAMHRRDAPRAEPTPVVHSAPAPATVPTPRPFAPRKRPVATVKNVEIDVPTRHADAIIQALQAAGWHVQDTGEVVATDEDEEGLTTIMVDVPVDASSAVSRSSPGEEAR